MYEERFKYCVKDIENWILHLSFTIASNKMNKTSIIAGIHQIYTYLDALYCVKNSSSVMTMHIFSSSTKQFSNNVRKDTLYAYSNFTMYVRNLILL